MQSTVQCLKKSWQKTFKRSVPPTGKKWPHSHPQFIKQPPNTPPPPPVYAGLGVSAVWKALPHPRTQWSVKASQL